MIEDFTKSLEVISFILQFGVIPIIAMLWGLNNKLFEIQIMLHRDFVKKTELKLNNEKAET